MIGIENMKKVVLAIAQLAIIGDAMGRNTGSDRWFELIELRTVVKELDGVDFTKIKDELSEIDAAERAELMKAFEGKFQLADKDLEAIIEDGLQSVLDVVAAGEKAWGFIGKLKAYGQPVAAVETPAQVESTDQSQAKA